MAHADYEVRGRRNGQLIIKVWPEGQRDGITHGIRLSELEDHESCTKCIEERAQRVAARATEPDEDPIEASDEDVPTEGSVYFEPGEDPEMAPPTVEEEIDNAHGLALEERERRKNGEH